MSIVLSNKRYEEIKRTVVDAFVRFDVTCVPVNGFEIATKMGVKVIPYSSKKYAYPRTSLEEKRGWILCGKK